MAIAKLLGVSLNQAGRIVMGQAHAGAWAEAERSRAEIEAFEAFHG